MTFDAIVTEITSTLDITSTEATTRIGRLVNRFYKRVTTSIGVAWMSRVSLTMSANTTIGSAEITYTSCEKVHRVWYLASGAKVFLREVTLDELRDEDPASSDTPTRWATKSLGGTSVVIVIDTLAETAFALKADGYQTVSTLATTDVPAFPESFHDVLVYGPLMVERKKMGHIDLAREAKEDYLEVLSNLRMWGAKSKYLQIRQHQYPASVHVNRDGDSLGF